MPDMPDMSGRLLLMSGRELRPCRTFCPAGFNTHKMSDKDNMNVHWYLPVINWRKCPTGSQNVRQSAEGLPDTLSGTPKIIFAITGSDHLSVCRIDVDCRVVNLLSTIIAVCRVKQIEDTLSCKPAFKFRKSDCYKRDMAKKLMQSHLCFYIKNDHFRGCTLLTNSDLGQGMLRPAGL